MIAEHFRRHPDADSYLSQPGFAIVLGGRTAKNRVTRSSRETPNVEHRKRNGSGPVGLEPTTCGLKVSGKTSPTMLRSNAGSGLCW